MRAWVSWSRTALLGAGLAAAVFPRFSSAFLLPSSPFLFSWLLSPAFETPQVTT